jgi:hypothetical protein
MKLPRHGVVEIETLRRYGRVPVGVRAAGAFAFCEMLTRRPAPRWQILLAEVRVGPDPRPVRVNVSGDFLSGGDGPRTWYAMHRRVIQQFHAADSSDYILRQLTHYIEDKSTGTGAQRFRVVQAEWLDDAPLPEWVYEWLRSLGLEPVEGTEKGTS